MNHIQKLTRCLFVLVVGVLLANATHVGAQVTYNSNNVFNVGTTSTQNGNVVIIEPTGPQLNLLQSGEVLVGSPNKITTSVFGGNGNVVILSNVSLTSSASNWIGMASQSNTVTLLSNAVWNAGGTTIYLGTKPNQTAFSSNNMLNVLAGGILSNANLAVTNLGSGAIFNNSFIVSNGGFAQINGINIGALRNGTAGVNGNLAYISNTTVSAAVQASAPAGTWLSTGAISIGPNGGMNNTGVLANVLWNGNAGTISVGSGRSAVFFSTGNALLVNNGSILTNFGSISVGYDEYFQNFTATNNSLIVSGPNTLLTTSGNMYIGGATGGNGRGASATNSGGYGNSMQVMGGATVLTTNLYVGIVQGIGNSANNGGVALGASNSVLVSDSGTTWTNMGDTVIGMAINSTAQPGPGIYGNYTINASANSLVVSNGASFWTTNLIVGFSADIQGANTNLVSQNQVIVNGGSLTTAGLEIGSTSASFAGTAVNNVGGANAASIANSVIVTNGGNLTVTKTLLVGDTSGNATGNQFIITGAGTATVNQAIIYNSNTLTFNGGVLNVSTLLSNASGGTFIIGDGLQSATLNLSGGHNHFFSNGLMLNTNATLHGDGTLWGDTVSYGLIRPGNEIGTLSVTGNLTLASTSMTEIELAALGVNDLLTASGLFNYGGELDVINTNGFVFASGQSWHILGFNPGNQNGDFAVTNLPNLGPGLAWDTSALDSAGVISVVVFVPEPSTFALMACSALGLMLVVRRKRR